MSGVTGIPKTIVTYLNPFSYFSTGQQATAQFNNFMETQYNYNHANLRYYPFTENNPFDSWHKKWIKALFGESPTDTLNRMRHRNFAMRAYDDIRVDPNLVFSAGTNTPIAANLGLGAYTPVATNSVWDTIQSINLENRLRALPLTPVGTPVDLPVASEISDWIEHSPKKVESPSSLDSPLRDLSQYFPHLSNSVEALDSPVASSSKVTLEALLDKTNNKPHHVLTEESVEQLFHSPTDSEVLNKVIESIPETENPFAILSELDNSISFPIFLIKRLDSVRQNR